ncbi:MFS transporter [Marinobacterium lutimaris]|uniref:MFS transporter, DHA2 family, methylenomycin A resistance protein n=1 Tax=Marinobacterium lutimaris TaxID=568106 RepID=A0A1H6AUJ5_9GAMM|nr:MFS transporter [Marinobacterium lutimaris]SEG52339.1 MFS transporter, DHA2 family, methylenomycin A resistance protein [Marinobacterium lutimaris]
MYAPTRREGALFNLAICLGFIIVQLDVSIVNVGIEALSHAYNAGIADLEWVINSYSLMFAALLLSSGSIADRFGTKRIFISGALLFMAASLACALAPTLILLEISRAVQGIGAALLVPASLTLIRHYYAEDVERRSHAISLWATSGSLALAAGPIVGGFLIEHAGWQSIFLINLPIGALCVLLTARFAKSQSLNSPGIDVGAQCLVIATLGLLTFALTESGSAGWASVITLGPLLAAIVTLILFTLLNRRSARPVLPLSIRGSELIMSSAGIGFLCTLIFYGIIFSMSLYFQKSLARSPSQTGWLFLPMMLSVITASYYSGRLGRYFRVRNIVIIGGTCALTGLALLYTLASYHSTWLVILPMMLIGAGTSLIVPGLADVVISHVEHQDAGTASAFYSCARQMGGVVGVALFGFILSGSEGDTLADELQTICLLASALVAIWLVLNQRYQR